MLFLIGFWQKVYDKYETETFYIVVSTVQLFHSNSQTQTYPTITGFRLNNNMSGSTPATTPAPQTMQSPGLTPEGQRSGSSRWSSLSSRLSDLTRSMTAGLSLVQRRSSRSSSLDCDLRIDKRLVERALVRHWQDTNIQVSDFNQALV